MQFHPLPRLNTEFWFTPETDNLVAAYNARLDDLDSKRDSFLKTVDSIRTLDVTTADFTKALKVNVKITLAELLQEEIAVRRELPAVVERIAQSRTEARPKLQSKREAKIAEIASQLEAMGYLRPQESGQRRGEYNSGWIQSHPVVRDLFDQLNALSDLTSIAAGIKRANDDAISDLELRLAEMLRAATQV
jgi:hypothetical protein